jgi:hypothetical protein
MGNMDFPAEMKCRLFLFLLLILPSTSGFLTAQIVPVADFVPVRIDTILIERNWRTRDRIIMAELEFSAGEVVTPDMLTTSLKKIWNLQNFASVNGRLDTLPDGRTALILTVRDAVTIQPIFAGQTNGNSDATLKLGLADRNFLGRNIKLELRGQFAYPEPFAGEVLLTIPRQLLWKNMSVGLGYQSWMYFHREGFQKTFIKIVNPFHEDYRDTFAPDLEIGTLKNDSFRPWIGHQDTLPDWYSPYHRNFGFIKVSESIGTITHRRHQEEGFCITGMVGAGLGLNGESESYLEGSILAGYHRLFGPRTQFSINWEGYYSSTRYSSLWTRFGIGDIRGTDYGEISGPLMQLASTGLFYTWLNFDWLALEQSVFLQYASALTGWGEPFAIKQHYAIGTGFQFTMPMYPAGSIYLSFSWSPNRSDWFYLEL